MNFRLLCITVILGFVMLTPSFGQDDLLMKTLDNGLLVVVKEHHTAPVVTVNVIIKTGSIYEDEYLGKGISHFLEHLVSGGSTPTRTEEQISQQVDAIGGQTNAYTSTDHTLYYISTATGYFDKALEIISDYMQNVIIDEYRFNREKAVIEKEINMGEDEPERVLWKLFNEIAFIAAPVRVPNIGYRDLFKSVTIEEVKSYYQKAYIPNNAIVLVVGDVDKSETFKKIEEAFKNWKRRSYVKPILSPEPLQTHSRFAENEMDIKETYLRIGYHTVELTHPDLYPLDILSYILTNGRSSRLYQKLKEDKKLVRTIDSWSITPSYGYGMFEFNCSLDYENVKLTAESIREELDKLKKELVSNEELERAKNQKISDNAFEKETAESLAGMLASSLTDLEDPYFSDTYTQNIQKVTAEDIKAVANKYFFDDNMTTVVLKPLGKEDKKSPITDKVAVEKGKVKKLTLGNGLVVLMKNNPASPTVSVQAHIRGGIRYENDKNNGISAFTIKSMIKGTKNRTGTELASLIESKGGRIDTYVRDDFIGVELDILSKDIETGIDILSDVVMNPAFSKESVETVRQEIISQIKQQEDDWQWEGINLFNKTRFGNHPYALPRFGTIDKAKEFKSDDCKSYHEKFCVPDNMVLTVFGDIDIDKTTELVKRYFEKFNGPHFEIHDIAKVLPHEGLKEATKKTKRAQCVITYGYDGAKIGSEDLYPLRLLDAITSGVNLPGGWLQDALRVKNDLVYFVHLMLVNGVDPGSIIIMTQCQPENYKKVISIIEETMERAKKGEFTKEEIDNAKSIVITSELIYYQTNSLLSQRAAIYELTGLGFDYMNNFNDKINKVTKEELKKAAEKYFKNPILTTIMPESVKEK
jgi:zinc protease